mgnify:CR=1 FL=1
MDLRDIKEIHVYDRAEFLAELEKQLVIEPERTVVLTVEMTKRRLNDRTPLPEGGVESLLNNTESLLSMARSSDIPVIHIMSGLRGVEVKLQEKRKWNQAIKNIGASMSPYGKLPEEFIATQDGTIEPDLAVIVSETDYIIKTKKALSSIYQTDLEMLLRTLKRDILILAGLSTNADILATAYDARNKGFGVITIKECVASVYGEDLHVMGLQQLARCQGIVVDLSTFSEKLSSSKVMA